MKIDLNCDLGESFGDYTCGMDEAVIPYVSSVNVACGWHAGDPMVMDRTLKLAREYGVAVGSHPGYMDLMGFGRRNMAITPKEAENYILYQTGALKAFADKYGIKLQHVKPHGALYNMGAKDPDMAAAVCEGLKMAFPDIILLGLSGSEWIKAAEKAGITAKNEIFADRAYMEDGSLAPRKMEGAVIKDPDTVIERAVKMVTERKVTTITGKDIPLTPDSICVHGDNPAAVELVRRLKEAFEKAGVTVAPMV